MIATRYWCLVTSEENWQICKKYNIFGLEYKYYVTLKKYVRKGDLAIVYSGGNFVAIVEIINNMKEDFRHIGWTKRGNPCIYPYRIGIKVAKEKTVNVTFTTSNEGEKVVWTPYTNILDDVVFIADKSRTWNQYIQVSIIRITKEDLDTIEAAMS